MYLFGELADKKTAQAIIEKLSSKNIAVLPKEVNGIIQLYVENETDHQTAFDVYRVALKIAPPPQEMPQEWEAIHNVKTGYVTKGCIALSVGIFILFLIKGREIYHPFFISNIDQTLELIEIKRGEWWRLITPVFLHFGFIHIIFNMLWLKALGSVFEDLKGELYFILFILIAGISSNLGQYYVSGPFFGGFSGVVYGLLGFVWINKIFNPETKYALPKKDIALMIGWFFLCFLGPLVNLPIANTAHGMGLMVGVWFGVFNGLKPHNFFKGIGYIFASIILSILTFAYDLFILPRLG